MGGLALFVVLWAGAGQAAAGPPRGSALESSDPTDMPAPHEEDRGIVGAKTLVDDLSLHFGRTPEGFGRQLVFLLILLSWPITAYLMWQQLWIVPDAEVLRVPRMVRPPTMQAFTREVLVFAAEALVLAALLWPRRRLYAIRLLFAATALPVWFIFTVPRGLTTVDQVHRRAIALLILLLWVSSLVLLVWRLVKRLSRPEPPSPA